MPRDSQRSWRKRRWRFTIGIALLGTILADSAQAVVFTVNSAEDVMDANPGDGLCETAPGNGACTLRAAIQETNALAGADQIILPPSTYLLTIVAHLVVNGDLTITGAGASSTIIDGNASVLRIDSGALFIGSGITVSISEVTIRKGTRAGGIVTSQGGGISNAGTFTLVNSIVSGNGASVGGGIFNGGTLTLVNSTVSGNGPRFGGGIFNTGTLTLLSSTVSGNHVDNSGGGISNGGTLTLVNSTVSGNSAHGDGGGIFNFGTVSAFNSTITDNRADSNLEGFGTGGGIFVDSGTFTFQNTIIAGNHETEFTAGLGQWVPVFGDCAGTLTSNGNNLMRVLNCTVNGSGLTVADPLLGPLQSNGGSTRTHALLTGSPAIDAGSSSGCRDSLGALLLTDQRGATRHFDGNNDGAAQCDIGAVEFGSGPGSPGDFDGDGEAT